MQPSANGFVGVAATGTGGLAVLNQPPAQSFQAGESLAFQLPSATFVVSADSPQLSVSARLTDGRPLPAWLSFNPATGGFLGRPPPGFNGELTIAVIARDGTGKEVITTFSLRVSSARDARPAPRGDLESGEAIFAQGRPSLADQFARHGKAQGQALLDHAARAARLRAS